MKKLFKALKLPVVFLLIFASFIACDKEFSVLDSDVLGKDNANFSTDNEEIPISAYNKTLNALQINGLNAHFLGVFNDPAYGQSIASIVSQVTPTAFNPSFGVDPVIDSVVINIPYFNKTDGTDDDGNTEYKLDSLYGTPTISMKLSVYKNNYFLRDFDPNAPVNTPQRYFSNASSNENTALNGTSTINFESNKGELLFNDDDFKPSSKATITKTGTGEDVETTRGVPALRLVTTSADNPTETLFWKNTIIDKEDDPVLSNANNFNDYFRGLYLKIEATNNDGSMVLLNLADTDAGITIHYTLGESDSRTQSTYKLNFTGNRLNTFINDYNQVTFPTDPDEALGDEILYLKGTEGSMAVVDLFTGMVECDHDNNDDTPPISMPAIDCFKKRYRQVDANDEYIKNSTNGNFLLKRLINEALLIIYEDENIPLPPVSDELPDPSQYHKYDRIYAYDINNNIPTVDYLIDPTENTQDAFNSRISSLGQRNPDTKKYKIRLTEHLNNILLRDSTNTKIGLVLSTNVNSTNSADILNSSDEVTEIPAAAIITPRGTILHGSNENVPDNKRLKLKVFFTEPNKN